MFNVCPLLVRDKIPEIALIFLYIVITQNCAWHMINVQQILMTNLAIKMLDTYEIPGGIPCTEWEPMQHDSSYF
jgi:hypothetical protein